MSSLEQTLSIIKPDAVERNLDNKIKSFFEKNNLKILKSKKVKISKEEASEFYKVHQTKPFYNELCKNIFKASESVNEKVWRLPLHKNYDKLMNSPVADVQNINYSGVAGSITAAQFLQRFILNKTPWAHLDIAGMAFSKKAANLNPGGATGFGVRLLNNLVKENYE